MQRLEDKAFRTLSSSASSASAASKRLLERGLSKLKAGHAKNKKRQPLDIMTKSRNVDWLKFYSVFCKGKLHVA